MKIKNIFYTYNIYFRLFDPPPPPPPHIKVLDPRPILVTIYHYNSLHHRVLLYALR